MSENTNMRVVWALVARARPHLSASQLRRIGTAFSLHRRQALELAAGLSGLPDAELARQMLVAARGMGGAGGNS
jgi:hypothetical protein